MASASAIQSTCDAMSSMPRHTTDGGRSMMIDTRMCATPTSVATKPRSDNDSHDDRYDIEFYWDHDLPVRVDHVALDSQGRGTARLPRRLAFHQLAVPQRASDYAEFPANYLSLHTKGQRMLRVAAAARAAHGRDAMAALYTAYGESIWHRRRVAGVDSFEGIGDAAHLRSSLQQAGLEASLADAADDGAFDDELREEVGTALSRTGPASARPSSSFNPPRPGVLRPVISRIPDDADALRLWDAVLTLGAWPGFAEIKRTMREMPQLPLLSAAPPQGAGGSAAETNS
jgi:hypothetical protein